MSRAASCIRSDICCNFISLCIRKWIPDILCRFCTNAANRVVRGLLNGNVRNPLAGTASVCHNAYDLVAFMIHVQT